MEVWKLGFIGPWRRMEQDAGTAQRSEVPGHHLRHIEIVDINPTTHDTHAMRFKLSDLFTKPPLTRGQNMVKTIRGHQIHHIIPTPSSATPVKRTAARTTHAAETCAAEGYAAEGYAAAGCAVGCGSGAVDCGAAVGCGAVGGCGGGCRGAAGGSAGHGCGWRSGAWQESQLER